MLDKRRLTKICEGLASPNATERAVSAAKATGMLEAAGLTWADVIDSIAVAPTSDDTHTHLFGVAASDLLAGVAARRRHLQPGEQEFVRTLSRANGDLALTRFQFAVLLRLAVQTGVLGDRGLAS